MKTVMTLLLLSLAFPVAAEEITVDKVLAAHGFGVNSEALLAKINDPLTTVPALTPADGQKLREAGVPETVVSAFLAKATRAAPVVGTQPDNPKAMTIVKAVQAGTSEALIVDQIMQNGVLQRPSLNDLIYLKENKVPEGIIRALMEAPIVAASPIGGAPAGKSAAPAPVPSQIEVAGLVRKTSFLKKSRPGKLVLTAEKIEWIDGTSQTDSFVMFPAGLKAVRTDCLARPDAKFCYEVEFEMSKGSDFDFVDAKSEVGGNESIEALLAAVKTLYPKLPIVEKVK